MPRLEPERMSIRLAYSSFDISEIKKEIFEKRDEITECSTMVYP